MADLAAEARRRGIRTPTVATLRRYGLTAEAWLGLLAAQRWRCPVCLRDAATVRLNTDHEHVPGWKKLPPAERARHVRGVLCAYCNYRLVDSRASAEVVGRVTGYLRAYEKRRDLSP